jgi:hypothetical protein
MFTPLMFLAACVALYMERWPVLAYLGERPCEAGLALALRKHRPRGSMSRAAKNFRIKE